MADGLTLNVIIASDELENLQAVNYNLCLGRGVQFNEKYESGNVVFSGILSQDLGPRIALEWQEKYQVYGTSNFETGAKITINTHTRDIDGGQQATFHKDGTVGLSGYPEPGKPFSVTNLWADSARIGVNQYDATSDTYFPFFVSPEVQGPSTNTILPMNLYAIFWDDKLSSGSMFENGAVSNRFWFSFAPGNLEVTLKYKNKAWATVGDS